LHKTSEYGTYSHESTFRTRMHHFWWTRVCFHGMETISLAGQDMMKVKKRIVIAEDHAILREGLKGLLSASSDFAVVGEAADGREAIRCVTEHQPDLLLIDLSMPRMNGTEAIREIKRRFPQIKILVLTMHKTEDHIIVALEAGADGYLLKDNTHSELLLALTSVLDDKSYISPGISRQVIQGFLETTRRSALQFPGDSLTQREREILKLIGEGCRNKEIAEQLCISFKTVEKHRANLRRKLDLHTTLALATYAKEKGLVES